MAIFHLAPVSLQADGTGFGKFECRLENFSVTGAIGDTVSDSDFDEVPVLRFVLLQRLVGAGNQVVTTLELRLAKKDTTVRIHRCPKEIG